MVNLIDKDTIQFAFKNFTGVVRGNYYYLSEPQIFLDIGSFDLKINSLSFNQTIKFL